MRQAIPKANLLLAIARGSLRWRDVIGELIDNSFDAGANSVSLSFDRGSLQVRDDGRGCPDLAKFVTLGDRLSSESTILGRYGIGAKDAALWIGGVNSSLEVTSTHKGRTRRLAINWWDMASNDWSYPDPLEKEAAPEECGTTVMIQCPNGRFAHELPQGSRWNEHVETIGYLYHRALQQGKQIIVKAPTHGARRVPVRPWQMPLFEGDVLDCNITIGGRTAHVHCGVISEGQKTRHAGMTYSHGFRVIIEASARGCGEYGTTGVCGIVDLDDKWSLTKNKNDIVGHAEELYAEVERVCTPILQRASRRGMNMVSASMFDDISSALNDSLKRKKNAKEKREPGNESGSHHETGTGSPRKRAKKEQSGSSFNSGSRRGWQVIPGDYGVADEIGKVNRPFIELNKSNPWIAAAMDQGNKMALVIAAASLIGAEHCLGDGRQIRLRGVDDRDFSKSLGSVLSSELSLDGNRVDTLKEKDAA